MKCTHVLLGHYGPHDYTSYIQSESEHRRGARDSSLAHNMFLLPPLPRISYSALTDMADGRWQLRSLIRASRLHSMPYRIQGTSLAALTPVRAPSGHAGSASPGKSSAQSSPHKAPQLSASSPGRKMGPGQARHPNQVRGCIPFIGRPPACNAPAARFTCRANSRVERKKYHKPHITSPCAIPVVQRCRQRFDSRPLK